MSKSSLFSLFSVAALSLGLTIPAGATTATVSSTLPSGYTYGTFASTLGASTVGGATYSGTPGTGTANSSVIGSYLDPLPSGNSNYFAYAEAGSTVTATFASPITTFALAWGSPDSYNTLTFNNAGGSFVPGQGALSALVANQSTTGYVVFTGLPSVTSITFASQLNAFEFDVLVPTAVTASPEPASIALLAGGLLAIGAGALRRRKS